jgi:hypothetical protein
MTIRVLRAQELSFLSKSCETGKFSMNRFMLIAALVCMNAVASSTQVITHADDDLDSSIELRYFLTRTRADNLVSLSGNFNFSFAGLEDFDEVRFTHYHQPPRMEPAEYVRRLPKTANASVGNSERSGKSILGVPLVKLRTARTNIGSEKADNDFELHWHAGSTDDLHTGWLSDHNIQYLIGLEELAAAATSIRSFGSDIEKRMSNPRSRFRLLVATASFSGELQPLVAQWTAAGAAVEQQGIAGLRDIDSLFSGKRAEILALDIPPLHKAPKIRELNDAYKRAVVEHRAAAGHLFANAVTAWPPGNEPAAMKDLVRLMARIGDEMSRPDDAISQLRSYESNLRSMIAVNQVLQNTGDGQAYATVLNQIGLKGLKKDANDFLMALVQLTDDLETHGRLAAALRSRYPGGTIIDVGELQFFSDNISISDRTIPIRFRLFIP